MMDNGWMAPRMEEGSTSRPVPVPTIVENGKMESEMAMVF